MARAKKEALYTRVNNPTLNRNIGTFNLSDIWDKVPFSISELKTKYMTSAPQHLCLRRLPTIIDLCTETSVLHEVS